jgi:hypothetical protein
MTLRELYLQAKALPSTKTPAMAFLDEVMEVAQKGEPTVRRWLGKDSTVVPDKLTQKTLAEHFNTTPEELFPTKKATS